MTILQGKTVTKQQFKNIITAITGILDENAKFEQDLEKVFGEDSTVTLTRLDLPVEKLIDEVQKLSHIPNTDVLNWWFFDNNKGTKGLSFFIDNVEYDGNLDNIYEQYFKTQERKKRNGGT